MDKIRIAIVDDSIVFCQILKYTLKFLFSDKIDVEYTQDSRTGVKYLTANKFDLVFLDVIMFHMSGFDVINKALELVTKDKLPIIILISSTRYDVYKEEIKNFKKILDDKLCYIQKPLTNEEILACVLRYFPQLGRDYHYVKR